MQNEQEILILYENYHWSLSATLLCIQQSSGWPTLILSISGQNVEAYSCQIK